jgi:hypothetical protein
MSYESYNMNNLEQVHKIQYNDISDTDAQLVKAFPKYNTEDYITLISMIRQIVHNTKIEFDQITYITEDTLDQLKDTTEITMYVTEIVLHCKEINVTYTDLVELITYILIYEYTITKCKFSDLIPNYAVLLYSLQHKSSKKQNSIIYDIMYTLITYDKTSGTTLTEDILPTINAMLCKYNICSQEEFAVWKCMIKLDINLLKKVIVTNKQLFHHLELNNDVKIDGSSSDNENS